MGEMPSCNIVRSYGLTLIVIVMSNECLLLQMYTSTTGLNRALVSSGSLNASSTGWAVGSVHRSAWCRAFCSDIHSSGGNIIRSNMPRGVIYSRRLFPS